MEAARTSAVSSETPREKFWCSKLTKNSSLFLISFGYILSDTSNVTDRVFAIFLKLF